MLKLMSSEISIIVAVFALLASAHPVTAQQVGKVYRIGYLTPGAAKHYEGRLAAFKQVLRELGYAEGRTR